MVHRDHLDLEEHLEDQEKMVQRAHLVQKDHQDTKDLLVWLAFQASVEYREDQVPREVEETQDRSDPKDRLVNKGKEEFKVLGDQLDLRVKLETLATLDLQDLQENLEQQE